jgi:flagellar basal body-associated protein FliL
MKRKWWIVGILVILELLVCGGMLLALWAGRTIFQGARFFYRADTHVEETVQETFVVDGPAVLDLEAVAGNVTVTGGTESEAQVTARLSLWGADEEDARQQ